MALTETVARFQSMIKQVEQRFAEKEIRGHLPLGHDQNFTKDMKSQAELFEECKSSFGFEH